MIDCLNWSFECFIGAILKAIEIETNTQHFDDFFYKIVKNENIVFWRFRL